MAAHSISSPFPLAPTLSLPSTSYAVIEYPGPVASTSASQSRAIHTLGGPSRLSKALQSGNGLVELNFRPDVTFSHAVGGENVEAGNMVLLKVIKRRRRRTDKTRIEGQRVLPDLGVYKVEAMGVVDRLIRFKSMADLQYQPQGVENDETIKLGNAIRNMDVRTMQQYRFPEPSEDFENDLRLLPPPIFSRLTLPQIYAYRANPLSIPVTVTKPNGTEVTRLVNKGKYKGEVAATIPFSAPASHVPMGPTKPIESIETKPGLESPMLEKVKALFEQRPIWTRNALLNNITRQERTRTQNLKFVLPFVSWGFSDGPFRDSCIRFGYDPRQHPEARFYQRIMIRNMANSRAYLKRVTNANTNVESAEPENDENSHIFDGESAHRNIGTWQLCDLTDPFLKEVIENEEFVRDTCDSRDGWWDGEYIEFIRQILKRKFLALLNEGVKLPDEAFNDLLDHLEKYRAQREYANGNEASKHVSGQHDDMDEDDSNHPENNNDQINPLGQRKIGSLRSKGQRAQKPKAKEVNPGGRSRNSLAPSHQPAVPSDGVLEHDAHIEDEHNT